MKERPNIDVIDLPFNGLNDNSLGNELLCTKRRPAIVVGQILVCHVFDDKTADL